MSKDGMILNRRRFLKTASQAGALLAMPYVIPGTALGKNGSVAPSERIVLGGIGIGNRGTYDLGCFLHEPDARFVAVCDVKTEHRKAAKEMVDAKYGNSDCATYVDLRELLARRDIDAVLIATGPNWHCARLRPGGPGRQGCVLRKALYENHRGQLNAGGGIPPDRPRVSGGHATPQSA